MTEGRLERARSSVQRTSVPVLLFAAFCVLALPLILFHLGSFHWFFRDEWEFITEREGRWPDLLEPHGGSHWVAVPRLAYTVMWQVFGIRTYVPYQAMVVVLHLSACALIVVIMRRAGVRDWLACSAGAALVLLDAGSQNIIWAFQISMVGSLTFGLAHLVLADHDGPRGWRDALGIAFGALAVMSSGIGITMVGVVGLALLLRHGWRAAALHVVPVALLVGVWMLVADPSTGGQFGRPSASMIFRWVRETMVATFTGIGGWPVVGLALALVMVVGLIVAYGPSRPGTFREAVRRTALPIALFAGSIVTSLITVQGRWIAGLELARSSRYVHLGAALTLPLLAVGAEALATRWRLLTPVLVGLLLVAVPFGWGNFEEPPFGKAYMENRERILTTAVRMPFAGGVPTDVQPIPDPYAGGEVNMGFLLQAERSGALNPSTMEITPWIENEFRVRLGVAARERSTLPPACDTFNRQRKLVVREGERFAVDTMVRIAARRGDEQAGPWVPYGPAMGTPEFTVELPRLELFIAPVNPGPYRLCKY
jgi:hypothetical protein